MSASVLLCDDTPEILEYLRHEIGTDPFMEVVGEATNGREAIQLAERLLPDVVLLDISMPIMDGSEALPYIKEVSPGSKVIVISGFTWTEAATRLPGDVVEGFVEKGTSLRSILDVLRRVCDLPGPGAEERFSGVSDKDLVDQSMDLLCIAGPNGYFLHVNPSWERVVGWTAEELKARPFIEFIHPNDRPRTIEEADELRHGRSSVEFENRFLCKDGSYRWLSWVTASSGDGSLLYARARDITEEKLVRDEREELAAIVRSSSEAIVGLDLNGTIRTWNPAAEAMYGYAAEEAIGEHITLIAQSRDEVYDFMARVRLGDVSRFETRQVTRSGSIIHVALTVSPTYTSDGTLIGASNISIDITSWKLDQTETSRLNDELEERVAARTKELRDRTEQLQRKAQELEESMSELDAFAYTVSHDLKAPLRAMDGFSRILIDELHVSVSDQHRTYLGFIRQNAQSMQGLVDGLLAFARLGRRSLQPVLLSPEVLVEQAVSDLGPAVDRGVVNIQMEEMPACFADPTLLKQVFVNLLSNAVKFTRGVDNASIQIGATEIDGQTAYFIRDNGVGFDARYSDRIFGVFQRLHRAEDYEGTGIGLANVQRIIDKHDGTVWSESELGSGATFYFTLGLGEEIAS